MGLNRSVPCTSLRKAIRGGIYKAHQINKSTSGFPLFLMCRRLFVCYIGETTLRLVAVGLFLKGAGKEEVKNRIYIAGTVKRVSSKG